MTGVLNVDTIADNAGTGPVTLTKQQAAKTWVNFRGTSTVQVNDSFSVSSVTDNGTGSYAANNTNSMSDANYNVACISNDVSIGTSSTNTASLYKIFVYNSSGSAVDAGVVHGNSHGDLA